MFDIYDGDDLKQALENGHEVYHVPGGRWAGEELINDWEGLVEACKCDALDDGKTLYEAATPRQLLDMYGQTVESIATSTPEEKEDSDWWWVPELAEKHGWDTPLYRADYVYGEGEWRTKDPGIEEAVYRYLVSDGYRVEDRTIIRVWPGHAPEETFYTVQEAEDFLKKEGLEPVKGESFSSTQEEGIDCNIFWYAEPGTNA